MNVVRAKRLNTEHLVDLDTGLMYGLGPRNRPYVTSVAAIGQAVCWLPDCPASDLDALAAWLQERTA